MAPKTEVSWNVSVPMPPDAAQRYEMAQSHLKFLDKNSDNFTFQTFVDDKSSNDARVLHGTLEQHWDTLDELNKIGQGIYVTVNETDLKGRKIENIVGIRAVWRENDLPGLPELPVKPHITVETSPDKFHEYIVINDCPLDEFEGTQETLVRLYGSDPNAKDRTRVLRLSGFYHLKDRSKPHLVRIVATSGAQPIPFEELKTVIPPTPRRQRKTAKESSCNGEGIPPPEVESALNTLDPDIGYLPWVNVGMALHNAFNGEQKGLDMWEDWSSKGSKFHPGECESKYKSFKPDGGITISTMFKMARDAGWRLENDIPDAGKIFASLLHTDTNLKLPRNKFRFTSAADLCRSPATTKWLIKNLLPEGIFALLFGGSGCGKSFLLLDICLSIGSQKNDCLGNPVKKHGPVLYICGEGHREVPRRIKGWSIKYGIDTQSIKFFASNQAVDMLDPASVNEMTSVIDQMTAEHGHPVLIGIDTVNRNFGPGDENSTRDMSAFVAACDKVRNRYQCTVFAVHHTGLGDASRSRGSNALRGALDMEFQLAIKGSHRVLTCTKAKDSEAPPPIQLVTEKINLWEVDDDGAPLSSLVFTVTDAPPKISKPLSLNNRMALEALAFLRSDKPSVHLEKWRKEFYARSPADTQDAKRKAFERARKELVSDGRVVCRDDQYWIFVTPGQAGQDRTNPDIVTPCPALDPDRTGQDSIESVPCPA